LITARRQGVSPTHFDLEKKKIIRSGFAGANLPESLGFEG